MTTAMGLALAIDYSLFVVSRFREETANGASSADAVRRTMQTAGRTVLFSALTVGLSLAAMLVFPVYFLRSFAYAGLAVVGLATLAALVLLPALLTLLGPRVNALDLRAGVRRALRRPAPTAKPLEQSFWYRFATAVMRRALPVALGVTALLVILGLPFAGAHFAYPDDRVLPTSAQAHQVGDDLRDRFGSNASSTLFVVSSDTGDGADQAGSYAAALSRLEGVTAVNSAAGTYADGAAVATADPSLAAGGATYLAVHTSLDRQSPEAKDLLAAVERTEAPWPTLVGGATADNRDSLDALRPRPALRPDLDRGRPVRGAVPLHRQRRPPAQSPRPEHALAVGDVRCDGLDLPGRPPRLALPRADHDRVLGADDAPADVLRRLRPVDGLRGFLLSRIREAWLESGRTSADNTHGVAVGLGRTGRIVTAAALLMAIVFAAIATSGISFMMMFGTGLTLAVLMDATVVRATLVPAFMKLAGSWVWARVPRRPRARLHSRIGLSEDAPPLPGSRSPSEPHICWASPTT